MFNLLLLTSVLSLSWASAPPKDSKSLFASWAHIREPSPGSVEPIGTYAAGCLSGAVAVPSDGEGYAAMRLSRHRLFAHPEMVKYLQALGERLHKEKQPFLLVGDVSPPRGGPMANGHNSHQIGLDADLWLRMSAKRPSKHQREVWSSPGFVLHRKTLKKSWGELQTHLIATAADFAEVNRIFVSPPIKRYLCEHFASAPWLYKIRPWWGHEEHVHVRLNCPVGSSQCQPQAPLDAGSNGCGEDLAWWFSEEADQDWAKLAADKKPRDFPELPVACQELGRIF